MILTFALLAFGAARMPYEAGLNRELQGAGLFPPHLELGKLEHFDQTSAAVALGGMRTLVATFLNLRAVTAFTEQRWVEVEDLYGTIVALAPRTRYYWESGAWHLAYNAASYYQLDSKLPPLRRREAWRSYIVKGRAFLERGISNNPHDWSLHASLGTLLADPNKFPAFRDFNATIAQAAEAYRKSAEADSTRAYVARAWCYALARVPGKEAEALALARKLYAAGPQNRTPTLRMILLVLEAHENPALDVAGRAVVLFGSPAKAYAAVTSHWRRTRERFPVYGVAAAMGSLEATLQIPKDRSIFNQPPPPPPNPDEWFHE